jgi:hypothetical protein
MRGGGTIPRPRPDVLVVGGGIVGVTAVRHQAPVVTSGTGDLTRIADSIGVKIRLFPT